MSGGVEVGGSFVSIKDVAVNIIQRFLMCGDIYMLEVFMKHSPSVAVAEVFLCDDENGIRVSRFRCADDVIQSAVCCW